MHLYDINMESKCNQLYCTYQVNDPWSKIGLFRASNEVVAAV